MRAAAATAQTFEVPRPLVASSLMMLLAAAPALAMWPGGGVTLERPASEMSSGALAVGPAGGGGCYVVWAEIDSTAAPGFRIHRLTAGGDRAPGWTTAGVRAFWPVGLPPAPILVPDSIGGTYVVWTESNDVAWVDRLAPDGSVSPGWPQRGLAVANVGTQPDLVATDDGAGGILLAWRGDSEIMTQRYLPGGARASGFFASGRPATTFALARRFRPQLVRDANRGFWLSFLTLPLDSTTQPACGVLHLAATGLVSAGQAPGGLPLSVPVAEIGTFDPHPPVALALDGLGGTFAFTLGSNGNVRAFHVSAPGLEDPSWPAGGRLVGTGAGWPSVHFAESDENWPVASGDGVGSAYTGWRDNGDFLLHAARVGLNGVVSPGWQSPPAVAGEMAATLIADTGGVFAAALAPTGCPHFDCYGPFEVARFRTDGTLAPGWPPANPNTTPAPGIALGVGGLGGGPSVVPDGAGGVFAGWISGLSTIDYHVTRLSAAGAAAGVPPAVAGGAVLRARFAPSIGVQVTFGNAGAGIARVELFDLSGRRVAAQSIAGSAGAMTLPGTRDLAPGVFMVRLSTHARSAITRVVVVR